MFKESEIANQYLRGLKGVEIGASYHNPFGLDTINVDLYDAGQHQEQQMRAAGKTVKIDVIANGDKLPFPDESFDFVINSHVIEHFENPIKALYEWLRVARKYVFMIVPHMERTGDRTRPLTLISEIIAAYYFDVQNTVDKHHYTYTPENFGELLEALGLDYKIIDPDDKVGNGFISIITKNTKA